MDIKNCTVNGLALSAVIVIGALSRYAITKDKMKMRDEELMRLHDIEKLEIEKNGEASESTKEHIRELIKSKL